jgi:hypothetical protein
LLINYDDSVITVKGSNELSSPEALRLVADNIRFNIGTTGSGTEKARIDSSGRLLVGTSDARSTVGLTGAVQVEGTGYDSSALALICNANSAGIASTLILAKSRGTSLGSNTIVQNGDSVGEIAFAGADGSDLGQYAAQIKAEVDGTPGANDMPGRLVFSTTADGASSPTERLRIAQNGAWGLAGANYGSSGQVLTSNGSGSAPTWGTGSSAVKAWVNFNGTGTVAIRASDNVSSITDNGTGDYTVNFTSALADANYAVTGSAFTNITSSAGPNTNTAPTASACRVYTGNPASLADSSTTSFAFFR